MVITVRSWAGAWKQCSLHAHQAHVPPVPSVSGCDAEFEFRCNGIVRYYITLIDK